MIKNWLNGHTPDSLLVYSSRRLTESETLRGCYLCWTIVSNKVKQYGSQRKGTVQRGNIGQVPFAQKILQRYQARSWRLHLAAREYSL